MDHDRKRERKKEKKRRKKKKTYCEIIDNNLIIGSNLGEIIKITDYFSILYESRSSIKKK